MMPYTNYNKVFSSESQVSHFGKMLESERESFEKKINRNFFCLVLIDIFLNVL
jgi:hypothetical protein